MVNESKEHSPQQLPITELTDQTQSIRDQFNIRDEEYQSRVTPQQLYDTAENQLDIDESNQSAIDRLVVKLKNVSYNYNKEFASRRSQDDK